MQSDDYLIISIVYGITFLVGYMLARLATKDRLYRVMFGLLLAIGGIVLITTGAKTVT